MGHVSKYCRNDQKCFKCGKTNHIARDCTVKVGQERNGSGGRNVTGQAKIAVNVESTIEKAVCMKISEGKVRKEEFYLDSCASHHMSPNKDLFTELDVNRESLVELGDDSKVEVKGVGKIKVKMSSGWEVTLEDVLFVPNLGTNLVSVGRITSK